MNPRQFYGKKTGRPVPDSFEVHHIDFNRENNEIKNLVALPEDLHHAYHALKPAEIVLDFKLMAINESGSGFHGWYLQQLEAFEEVYNKCNCWVDYREFLLGNLPDIGRVNYGICVRC